MSAILLLFTLAAAVQAPQPTVPPSPSTQTRPAPRDPRQPAQTGTSVIKGRVLAGDTGRPLRRAAITATAPELGTDNRTVSTGLDGRYEIKDLPAGRYTIRVQRSGYLPLQYGQRRPLEAGKPLQLGDKQAAENIDFTLPRTGVISGRVTDELGDPIANVSVFAMRSMWFEGQRKLVPASGPRTVTDDDGEYRIRALNPATYFVMAVSNDTWTQAAGDRQDVMSYAPTYHPGAASASEARAVAVGVGQRLIGIDIALVPGRAARLAGIARDSQGRPLQNVNVEQSFRGPTGASFSSVGNASVLPDGTFIVRDVPPGEYALNASATGSAESVRQPIVVTGEDVDGIILTATSGWRISGQVIAEDGTAPPIPRERLRVTGRMISWPFGRGTPGARNPSDDLVAEDWTFRTTALFGAAQIRVAGLPEGWGVKGIYREGRDITDTIEDLASGEELAGVQIVLTDRLSTVSGQLADQKGAPLGDGTVLVFADDPQRWTDGSRWVASARPDQSGRYQFRGLPAGAYLAIALEYVEEGIWNDAVYLDSIRHRAERFVLGDAATQTLALKIAVP
jgi:hypothetical protein